ncbi:DUF262 domain-containing protein [Burkholderia pseudomallei]|nr:DUF262 domain-containing protein [Burkholderia pseudomallei]
MTTMRITPVTLTLKQFFGVSNEQFLIPTYQRHYAWGQSQQRELFDDVRLSTGCARAAKNHKRNARDGVRRTVILPESLCEWFIKRNHSLARPPLNEFAIANVNTAKLDANDNSEESAGSIKFGLPQTTRHSSNFSTGS